VTAQPLHAIDAEDALGLLDSRREGLSSAEASARLAEYGPCGGYAWPVRTQPSPDRTRPSPERRRYFAAATCGDRRMRDAAARGRLGADDPRSTT
jgi:Cation transporter/ATPase, N-terminus